jgi:hypothetical protein
MPTLEDMIYQRRDEERARGRFLVRARLSIPVGGCPLGAHGRAPGDRRPRARGARAGQGQELERGLRRRDDGDHSGGGGKGAEALR